ncbi:MAG: hypothetical protein ABI906_02915 [Pseudomonadota bacterium]
MGLFFALAMVLTAAAGASLLSPNGPLDVMWRLKPSEHAILLRMGPLVGIGFIGLSAAMMATSVGCFARRRWGWGLAVAIFVVNGLADAARVLGGAPVEGALGVTVATLIVWWLTRPRVRRLFT